MEPAALSGFKLPELKGIEGVTVQPKPETLDFPADLELDKFIDEEFYPGISKNTIYTDLGAAELYTKNAVAKRVTKDRNMKHYFSPDNIGKTVDELAQEQEGLEQGNRFMEQVDWIFANGMDLDELEDDFFQKEVEDLNALAMSKPERAPKPPIEMPSEIMLALGGVFELFAPPGQQFRALSVPFGYMVAKNPREMQEAEQLYQERLRDWAGRLGLKQDQVKMIADRQTKEYEVKQKHLAEVMTTRYGVIKDSNDLQLAYDRMKHDTNLAVYKADSESFASMKKEAFSLMSTGKSPDLRALGAAMLGSLTGLDIPVQMSYTPEELKTLAEQSGLGLDNALKQGTLGPKIAEANLGAQKAAIELQFLPEQLRAGLQQTFSVTNLNSVRAATESGRLSLDYLKFEESKTNAKSVSDLLKGTFDGLDTVYTAIKKDQSAIGEKMATRRAEVLKEVKLVKYGMFGDRAAVDKHNKRLEEEALAKDGLYQEFKRQNDGYISDLAEIDSRRQAAGAMTISSIRPSAIAPVTTSLAKVKTDTAYMDILARALDEGKITPLEAARAIQIARPPSGNAEGIQRQILNRFAIETLKDPGIASQYVDAILKEMGGVSGEVGLGSGPFPPPDVRGDE
jgi:hypothetical protein